MPSKPSKSWERGAKLVKNTKVENQYLDHIRDLHDPSLHLKTIEDELKGTIGKALGKQGEKILRFLKLMEEERQKHNEILYQIQQERTQQHEGSTSFNSSTAAAAAAGHNEKLLIECITKHNEYRSKAIQARWELTVHRQAVGFIVNNHKFVQDKFPIGEALKGPNETTVSTAATNNGENTKEGTSSSPLSERGNNNDKKQQQFGDQLDWWQRIGRWK